MIKGFELKMGCLFCDVVEEILGIDYFLVVLLGFIFVKEMVVGLFMVILLFFIDDMLSDEFVVKLYCVKLFRVYKNLDFIGV